MPLRTARVQNILLRDKPEESREKEKLFGEVAEEWLAVRREGRASPGYLKTVELRISKYIEPALFSTPINDVTAPQVLTLIFPSHGCPPW